ncbi:hypothetical protein [Actinoplanes sp. NPDC049802]|uniref:hypothetical protein n=1 Tax=Actinoplanes sp. NPDC049802 TaxID=3154742 RepID=UPI0033BFE68F
MALTLWALATGDFPALDVTDDYDAVHRQYGAPFGPWAGPYAISDNDSPKALLAAAAVVAGTDRVLKALEGAAADWRMLGDGVSYEGIGIPDFPEHPTVGDVVARCPHGLLVARGLVRITTPVAATETIPSGLVLPVDQAVDEAHADPGADGGDRSD